MRVSARRIQKGEFTVLKYRPGCNTGPLHVKSAGLVRQVYQVEQLGK